mmetsp:Transcript_19865/g.49302  ORF Transcript_19865/g.49302 Transcript_19865/m.49302 type:complete len:212 (+) Transcript_19865:4678-5313(+)
MCLCPAGQGHREAAGGVNGSAHLHPHVARLFVQGEVVPLQHHGEAAGSLEHGKLVADALACARTEWNERKVRGHLVRIEAVCRYEVRIVPGPVFNRRVCERPFESHGIELFRVLPAVRRSVKVPDADEHVHAFDEGHVRLPGAPGKLHVLQTPTNQDGRLRVKPQRLREAQAHQLEFLDLFVRRRPCFRHHRAHNLVDLSAHLVEQRLVLN